MKSKKKAKKNIKLKRIIKKHKATDDLLLKAEMVDFFIEGLTQSLLELTKSLVDYLNKSKGEKNVKR